MATPRQIVVTTLVAALQFYIVEGTGIYTASAGPLEVDIYTTPGRPPFIHASLATNLSARAEVHNEYRKLLVLNITWVPPTEGPKLPENYNLLVTSLAASTDKYCRPNDTEYKHFGTGDTWTYMMPSLLNPTTNEEMKIKAGCSYSIKLQSNPYDGETSTNINYTVPDCVGRICDCSLFRTLPAPQVRAASWQSGNVLNITWSYPSTNQNAVNITDFNIALSHSPKNHSFLDFRVIGRTSYRINSSGSRDIIYNHAAHLNRTLLKTEFYLVEVSVEDSNRKCHGPAGNITFQVPTSTASTSEPTDNAGTSLLIAVLLSVCFVLVCCFVLYIVWLRCGTQIRTKFCDGNIQPIPNWQGVYKNVVYDGKNCRMIRSSYNGVPERNVIYVEQEIEEAKARGDADKYEVSYERLEMSREIGKGAFGRVFLARAESIAGVPGFMTVAVKKLKKKANNDEVEEFLSEIAMLKQVGRHPNIVTLLGCVTIKTPYCMIMEYIPCGDLLQYLRHLRVEYERRTGSSLPFTSTRQRPRQGPKYVELLLSGSSDESYIQPDTNMLSVPSSGRPSIAETEWSLLSNDMSAPTTPNEVDHKPLEYILDPKELQNFAVQIARGMAHLEGKQITHRDLAARNVLIDENRTLKISDFGLSRSGIYVNTKRKKVPLRWLSVEAIRDNLYSSKSDVWAFAIVLWEIGTLGGFPYPTIADYDLLTYLLDGRRLDKPDNCTDELYNLMLVCWSHAADQRPSFADLVSILDSVICRRRVYVNFENLRPDYTFPPTEQVPREKETIKKAVTTSKECGPGPGD